MDSRARMFIGNPFTDVPDLCSNVLLVADGDSSRAEREAVAIADEFWAMREHLQQPLTPLAESVRLAAASDGHVVLVDAADATSSGASGDSNAILRALIDAHYHRTALVPIVDAPAAAQAFRAGVGATIRVALGGTLDPHVSRLWKLKVRADPARGPVPERVPRRHLERRTDGPPAGGQLHADRSQPAGEPLRPLALLCEGQDPMHFDTVIVKSPRCQPHMFSDTADLYIDVDAPGSTSANLQSLGHTRCARPMFPLDKNVSFTPARKCSGAR